MNIVIYIKRKGLYDIKKNLLIYFLIIDLNNYIKKYNYREKGIVNRFEIRGFNCIK